MDFERKLAIENKAIRKNIRYKITLHRTEVNWPNNLGTFLEVDYFKGRRRPR